MGTARHNLSDRFQFFDFRPGRDQAPDVELGLENTHSEDPSGLLSANVSSAYDIARLMTHASQDERISSVMRLSEDTVYTAKHRVLTLHSTNHLLGRPDLDVRAGKTGFISKAGYGLATLLQLPDYGPQLAMVVLGARSHAGQFMETRNLYNWLHRRLRRSSPNPPSRTSSSTRPRTPFHNCGSRRSLREFGAHMA
jgi:D-alanyl-D-alanine carboxypeptidase